MFNYISETFTIEKQEIILKSITKSLLAIDNSNTINDALYNYI